MNKLTIEFVKSKFEEKGWQCVSDDYIDSRSLLNYICPNGHSGVISWNSWSSGTGCSTCSGKKKHTIEFVKIEFEKKGWVCVSTEYINAHQKLDCICPNGHYGSITWSSWQQGYGCSECAGNKKHTIEFIRSEFEKKGWILVSKKYVGTHQKLDYICPEGHYGSITWSSWQRGAGCSECAGVKKHTIEFVKSEFEKEGWVCLSKEYINSSTLLEYICSEGHYGKIRWSNWHQGQRCTTCAGNKQFTIEFVRSEFENGGYILDSKEYINSQSKLDYICPEGHHGSMSWSHWKRGVRCPICAIIKSSGSGNSNWKGGISGEPYCPIWKDKEYAESIKQRDGYKCMNPYCNSKDSKDLVRHHINYNIQDCRLKNIITTCRSCNSGANGDREWHEAWYKAIMYRRYGYIYE